MYLLHALEETLRSLLPLQQLARFQPLPARPRVQPPRVHLRLPNVLVLQLQQALLPRRKQMIGELPPRA